MAMMDKQSEPGGVEALLPWYVKGTLSTSEMREVEAYLTSHPEAKAMLALMHEEMDETIAANESVGFPSAAVRDRLFAAIAEEASESSRPPLWQRIKAKFVNILPNALSPRLALGGALAALTIIVQAVVLGVALQGDRGIELARGNGATAKGTYLLVYFSGNANTDSMSKLLKSFDAVIVDGPKPGNGYKVRISKQRISKEERSVIIEKLRKRSDIVKDVR
jgi:hypothetical protein